MAGLLIRRPSGSTTPTRMRRPTVIFIPPFALNHWLIYATGGGIGVNYETRFVDDCSTRPCSPGTVDAHEQDFDWGYTVGGGFEYMFGCHWSIKGEYLYFSLDDQDFSAPNNFGAIQRFNGETTGHIVRGGLNYKF